ncbi:phosphotriesterase [Streptomyces sp. NPDC058157]|uniref:phosphotriesterase family protein n=1 Tax=Streptomyces sp. NPDC058157 TaxID=3346360 RepID=UPI0036E6B8DF
MNATGEPVPTWTPRTVRGTTPASSYDTVLAHEHVFIDLRCWLDSDDPLHDVLGDQRVHAGNLELVRQNPFACPDNLVLDDMELAVRELTRLAEASPRPLLVDLTPDTTGRDPRRLAEVSARTGVDIIAGCGPYIDGSWPDSLRRATPEQLADAMVAALTDPDHPAGVIGEIGTGSPVTECETTALIAAAQAHRRTGAPVFVHLHPWHPEGAASLDILERHGVDPARISLCHLDVRGPADIPLLTSLLDRGCHIAFDIWGDEHQYGRVRMPKDTERLRALLRLIELGYGDRLTHSHDVCTRTQLAEFGGVGYDHLPRNLPGWLRDAGLDPETVHQQLAGNALRFLGISPRPAAPEPVTPPLPDWFRRAVPGLAETGSGRPSKYRIKFAPPRRLHSRDLRRTAYGHA